MNDNNESKPIADPKTEELVTEDLISQQPLMAALAQEPEPVPEPEHVVEEPAEEPVPEPTPVQTNHIEIPVVEQEKVPEEKPKSIFMGIVKFICIILTLILIGCLAFAKSLFTAGFEIGMGGFLSLAGLVMAFNVVLVIGIIWGVYFVIKAINYEYHKANKNDKKIILIASISFIVAFIGCSFAVKQLKEFIYKKETGIAYYLDQVPDYEAYGKNSYYFAYNDKIYFYNYDEKKENHNFYSMNLDGSDMKLITTDNKELVYPGFYLVYNNEAYFVNSDGYVEMGKPEYNKKINLETGEITNLNNEYNFLPYTFNNGKIDAYGDRVSSDFKYRTYDLDKDEVVFNAEVEYYPYYEINKYYDFTNNNIYGIVPLTKDKEVLYRVTVNEEIIDEVTTDEVYDGSPSTNIGLLYEKDNMVYISSKDRIYRYNINTKTVDQTVDIKLPRYSKVKTNDKDNFYIYFDYAIYKFIPETISLEKIIDIPKEEDKDYSGLENYNFDETLYFGDKHIILPIRGNLIKNKSDILGRVLIYDKETKKLNEIKDVRRTSFDYENKLVYLFIKDGKTYKIEKYEL